MRILRYMWWWRQKVHISRCIAMMSAGFVAGVAFALVTPITPLYGLGAIIIMAICFYISRRYVIPVLCLSSVVIGLGYGSAHLIQRSVYQQVSGQVVTISGHIKEDPSRTASGAWSWQLDKVVINDKEMPGIIYASFRGASEAKRGDIVQIVGEVGDGFGNFPISVSVQKVMHVMRSVPGDVGRVVRDWFADWVRQVIPEPQASLGIGFLTGQKSALPSDLSDALKIAGLTHIVVASGYNLTILVRMARTLLAKVSKYMSTVSAGLMIVIFMAITGLSPSMTRAGLVSGMSLLAWYYGHAFTPFVLLPVAAAVTVALQPGYVWGDLGWQLSFSAFAGVMIVAPLLQLYFFGQQEPGILRQILGETIAAHVVTMPVIALSFGTVSNVAIIANLLVVPLVPLAMLLTFFCGLGAIIALPFINLLAVPTTWLLGYMIQVATYVSELSWAQSEVASPAVVWGAYTLVLTGACVWMWRATRASAADHGQLLVQDPQTYHRLNHG